MRLCLTSTPVTCAAPAFSAANEYRPSWLARSSTRAPSRMSRLLPTIASYRSFMRFRCSMAPRWRSRA